MRNLLCVLLVATCLTVAVGDAYACEPVRRAPTRPVNVAVVLATAAVQPDGQVRATVAAGRSSDGVAFAGEMVFVPWAFGPDCRRVAWATQNPEPWSPPPSPAVYTGMLRARDQWIDGKPTVDIEMARLQPIWSEDVSARREYPQASGLLTAREFFDFYLSLPTDAEFERVQKAALDRANRWSADHPPLAASEPAASMLKLLRFLWEHRLELALGATRRLR